MGTRTILIRGGLVVTPAGAQELDIVVRDERIDALEPRGSELPAADETIEASGHVVLPGVIDGHTHFVQDDPDLFPPDPIEYEGFALGGRGAAAGGVTTHVEMPQSRPPTTDGATFRRKRELAEPDAIVDFALWGGVVQGQPPSAIDEQISEGAVAFKAFMCNSDPSFPGVDDVQLVDTLAHLSSTPFMLGVHAENDVLLRAGIERMRSAGRTDPLAHAESRPPIVEIEAVTRAITFAEHTGAWVHIVHMSTGAAADAVAAARARDVEVTCETCPQYLALDHDDLQRLGPFARCAPPIRSRDDVERLWQRLADGTIDCVTTDHCAFTYDSRLPGREDIFEAPNGLPGIQTLVPVFVTEARKRGLAWEWIAALLSAAPARLWQLAPRKGSITEGAEADLVLLDPQRRWTIQGADFVTAHRWTPFEGFQAEGRIVRTLLRGTTIYDETSDEPQFAPPGTGRFIPATAPITVGGH
jgi:allantoinase